MRHAEHRTDSPVRLRVLGAVAALCAVVLIGIGGCTSSAPLQLKERNLIGGADRERLTDSLVVDAHVIGTSDVAGDCGPLGSHTASCEGPGEVQLAASLLNAGTAPDVVPVFEARCDGKHAANGAASGLKAGDAIHAGERRTDTVTFDLRSHRCPVPILLIYRYGAKQGDPALAVPVPLPI